MTALDRAVGVAPIVAIVRLPGADGLVSAARAVLAGGVRALEITLTTPGAAAAVTELRGTVDGDVVVGAGSVRTPADVTRAVDAGAQFLVTPTTRPAVLDAAAGVGVPAVAGGFTPSELDLAREHGAAYQKLFPASAVFAAYVREVLAPMPDLRIVPTGGITVERVGEYRDAGAAAVAVGSALVDARTTAERDWGTLTRRAEAFVAAWEDR